LRNRFNEPRTAIFRPSLSPDLGTFQMAYCNAPRRQRAFNYQRRYHENGSKTDWRFNEWED
jgi:hypothetical protein